jgi:hypothetical protein
MPHRLKRLHCPIHSTFIVRKCSRSKVLQTPHTGRSITLIRRSELEKTASGIRAQGSRCDKVCLSRILRRSERPRQFVLPLIPEPSLWCPRSLLPFPLVLCLRADVLVPVFQELPQRLKRHHCPFRCTFIVRKASRVPAVQIHHRGPSITQL